MKLQGVLSVFLLLLIIGCDDFEGTASRVGDIGTIVDLPVEDSLMIRREQAQVVENLNRLTGTTYNITLGVSEVSLDSFDVVPDTDYILRIDRNDSIVLGVEVLDANQVMLPWVGDYLVEGDVEIRFRTGSQDSLIHLKLTDQYYRGGEITYALYED